MYSELAEHRRGAPGGTSIHLLIIFDGGNVLGTGILHFARAFKGLRGAHVCKWDWVGYCPWRDVVNAGSMHAYVDD